MFRLSALGSGLSAGLRAAASASALRVDREPNARVQSSKPEPRVEPEPRAQSRESEQLAPLIIGLTFDKMPLVTHPPDSQPAAQGAADPRAAGREGRLFGLQLVALSQGALKRGTVYVTLGRMEAKGFVRSEQEAMPPGAIGLPRRLYYPTPLGERVLASRGV